MKAYTNICVAVGHYSKKQGVKSQRLGISEWQINSLLAKKIERLSGGYGLTIHVISDLNLIRKVRQINDRDFDICIDLHCNAAPTVAAGHEILCYHTSRPAEVLAHFINDSMRVNHARKVKIIDGGAGSFFLSKTKPVAVLIESCFADEETDFYLFASNLEQCARDILNGIRNFNSYRMIKPYNLQERN